MYIKLGVARKKSHPLNRWRFYISGQEQAVSQFGETRKTKEFMAISENAPKSKMGRESAIETNSENHGKGLSELNSEVKIWEEQVD